MKLTLHRNTGTNFKEMEELSYLMKIRSKVLADGSVESWQLLSFLGIQTLERSLVNMVSSERRFGQISMILQGGKPGS